MAIQLLTGIMASGLLLTAFLVITAKNPVLSVFYLVLAFIQASILLLVQGIEFISLLFIIVYVGAIAILFLFVVMMLNIKKVELLDNTTRYVPIGFIIGIIFIYNINEQVFNPLFTLNTFQWQFQPELIFYSFTNTRTLAEIIYTEYSVYFLMSGLILLIAMIGVIVLTISHEEEIKRQDIFSQISTEFDKTVKLNK